MRASAFRYRQTLRPLAFSARQVPHAVIETNYTCNRRCTVCYNRFRQGTKSFAQIVAEIDLACSKRNLETISLLGGEPTLHPDLPAVVRHIKQRGLVCQLLTNGLTLYQDRQQKLLTELIGSGLDRVILHIDSGQGLDSPALEQIRIALFDQIDSRRLLFALAVTLYPNTLQEIPSLMRRYARYRYFDGLLATLAQDMDSWAEASPPQALSTVYTSISAGLGVEPAAYLPSNLDAEEIRWLIYFYYLNARTGVAVGISPVFSRLIRRAYRFFKGKHLFAAAVRPSRLWFLTTAAMELLLKPRRLREFIGLSAGSSRLNGLRFQYVVVQQAPQLDPAGSAIEFCSHCPDATIRNGRWAPVCLADRMSPPLGIAEPLAQPSWAQQVYRHLEEVA